MLTRLLAKISEYLPNHGKSCVKNVLVLSLCLLIQETVNLNKLKGTVGAILGQSSTQASSNYKRLIRVFDRHSDSSLWLDLLVFAFTFLGLRGDYLILDGTSWRSGKVTFHFLTLCVVYRNVAIAIFWRNLQKIGHSNTQERIGLVKGALRRFDLSYSVLIADGEYIGHKWFRYLIDNDIDFVIRLKRGTYKEAIDHSKGSNYEQLCAKVKRSKVAGRVLGKPFVLEGMSLNFVVLKNRRQDAEDPLVCLVTSLREPARLVAEKYRIRWKIEALRSAAAVQAYENQWLFAGGHEPGYPTSLPAANGHRGVFLRALYQGRAENVQESAGETVLGRVTGNGRIPIQARHQ